MFDGSEMMLHYQWLLNYLPDLTYLAVSLAQEGLAPNSTMNWCCQYVCKGFISSEDLKNTLVKGKTIDCC